MFHGHAGLQQRSECDEDERRNKEGEGGCLVLDGLRHQAEGRVQMARGAGRGHGCMFSGVTVGPRLQGDCSCTELLCLVMQLFQK